MKSFSFILKISCALSLASLTSAKGALIAQEPANEDTELNLSLTEQEEQRLDDFMLRVDEIWKARAESNRNAFDPESARQRFLGNVIQPLADDVNFPQDPVDDQYIPTDDYFPFPMSTKNGASEKLAIEVLFQTLNFYGVSHVVEKKGTQVNFQVIQSKYGYFTNLTKLDVAYAIREFARFFTAYLCGQANMQNFYKAFAQVPAEEIGLRFKYDMAWALLGNSLPKEPNQVQSLGTKWKALQQILATTSALKTGESASAQGKELRSWAGAISDVVNILGRLNKLMCFVDIRPNPKDELKKRVVVGKILEMEKKVNERYNQYKDLLDQVQKEAKAAQLNAVRQGSPTPPSAPPDSDPRFN